MIPRYRGVFALIMVGCTLAYLVTNGLTQTTGGSAGSGIRLSASVDKNQVPLNRTLVFTIRMEWYGELDKYEVHQFDNPLVQNLEIIANASSNRVAEVGGQNTSVLDYDFTLKPKSLGMGYVEGVIIKYTDRETNKEYRLITNRIEVKVVDPLPEPGSKNWLLWAAGVFVLSAVSAGAVLQLRRKKNERERKAQEAAAAAVPMEEGYLAQLRGQINLQDPDLDVSTSFAYLARLLRRFLSEKLSLPGLEATTEEIIQALHTKNLDERCELEISEILSKADLVKFSGGSMNKSELDRAYTLLEANLQRSQRGELYRPAATEASK